MEVEENRSSKRSRIGNGIQASQIGDHDQHQDDDEEDGGTKGRLRPWHHPSSRIFRVSRASGGKDRHSKVYTAKGLRDRRVRLSVSTAIQFYDLQDRLGYDQPSKAIEWLIKAAASAIAELPSLNTSSFPEPSNSHLDSNQEKPPSDLGLQDPEPEPSYNQQQHSSASETSKGSSALSLSRSEIRNKARERAKERALKDKKERDDGNVGSPAAPTAAHYQNVGPGLNSQSSFTDLLTGGSSSTNAQPSPSANFIQKQIRTMPPVTSTADYFSTQSGGLFGQQLQQKPTTHQIPSGFPTQVHFGTSSPMGMVPFSSAGDHPAEMQQFAFLQDHFFPVATAAAAASGDYNLNFSISSGLAGFHRGTLQSNSSPSHQLPHHHHQHHHHPQLQAQRLSSPLDGSNAPVPFFFGTAATSAAAAVPSEGHYSAGFDGHLQLCDGYKNMELKGKGKS